MIKTTLAQHKLSYKGVLFGLIFLIVGVVSLPNYGVNWDEPNHFGRGQAILHFFLTGEKDYKRFISTKPPKKSFYQNESYSFNFFEEQFTNSRLLTIGGHPPLSGFLAAIFNVIFYQKLGILGDIEAYHLYSVFLAAVFTGVLFYFVRDVYGSFPALVSSISLITYPLILGESRFNIKDVPEAVYFGITIICFYYTIVRNSQKWMILTAIFFGLGLSTKLNILFALPIMFLWASLVNKKIVSSSFLVIPLVGMAIFLASWPMLWADPVNRILKVLAYYKGIGTNTGFDPRYLTIFRFNTYAWQFILYTTPLVTLFLSLLGTLYALRYFNKEKYRPTLLILLWFFIPIMRVTLPNTNIYGGVRQIMEYIPALAILSGIGASRIVILLNGYIVKILKKRKQFNNIAISQLRSVLQLLVIASFLPITIKMVQMHPNESVYFNPLIGGLRGAASRNIPGWGNSLGSTYRQGTRWLNENAEEGAKLSTGFGLRSNIALIDLRPDVQFENRFRSGPYHDGEYIIGVTHEGTQEDLYLRKYLDRFLTPLYEVDADGVAVLKVWKNDVSHMKVPYMEHTLPSVKAVSKHGNVIDIDIGNTIEITRLIISYGADSLCSLPKDGYLEYSVDGNRWQRAANDFITSPIPLYFNSQPKPTVVQFLFAADTAAYLRLVVGDNNSCLVKNPISVTIVLL